MTPARVGRVRRPRRPGCARGRNRPIAAGLALSATLAVASAQADDAIPGACRAAEPVADVLVRLGADGTGRLGTLGLVRLADVAAPAVTGAGDASAATTPADALRLPVAVRVHPVGDARDRYGDRRVHLEVDGAGWLQARLVAEGLAVVRPSPAGSACVADLLAIEAEARRRGRGIWETGAIGPWSATDAALAARAGRYALVEGRVVSHGRSRRVAYLNFGEDWSRDFTVLVRKTDLETWPEAARDLERFVGRRVRARGTLEAWNGALIRAEHPAQIEILARRAD